MDPFVVEIHEKRFYLDLPTLESQLRFLRPIASHLDLLLGSQEGIEDVECMRRTISPSLRTLLRGKPLGPSTLKLISKTLDEHNDDEKMPESWPEFWSIVAWKSIHSLTSLAMSITLTGVYEKDIDYPFETMLRKCFNTYLPDLTQEVSLLDHAKRNPVTMNWNVEGPIIKMDNVLSWRKDSPKTEISMIEDWYGRVKRSA